MEPPVTDTVATADRTAANNTAFAIIAALSFCHLLNDMMQSLISAIYPMLKTNYGLDFGQIGLLTFTFQVTASLLQPLIGIYTDKRPLPYSLPLGMGFTLVGLILLGVAAALLAAARRLGAGRHRLVGVPSRILARRADGVGRPARPCAIAVPGRRQFRFGARAVARRLHRAAAAARSSVAWFSLAALLAMIILWQVGNWYRAHGATRAKQRNIAARDGRRCRAARSCSR